MTLAKVSRRAESDSESAASTASVKPSFHPSWFWRDIFVPFVVTRLLLLIVASMAMKFMASAHPDVFWNGSTKWWINAWARWDTFHYISIVRGGYVYAPGVATNIAFAPLYSMLIKALGIVLGQTDTGWLLAGMVISNAALLVSLYYFVVLIRLDYDEEVAARAVLYLLAFPTTLFLSAVYPMSLIVALTLAAFYHARRRQWWLAGLIAGFASLARNEGIVIVAPLLYEYLAQRHFRFREVRADVLALGIAPLVFAGWAYELYRISGVPLLIFSAGRAWGRKLTPPWQLLRMHNSMVDLAAVGLFFVLIVACWRSRIHRSYTIFASLYFLILISSGLLNSFMRYGLTLFPCFIVLALGGRNQRFDRLFLVFSAGLACLNMAMFALWYPAG